MSEVPGFSVPRPPRRRPGPRSRLWCPFGPLVLSLSPVLTKWPERVHNLRSVPQVPARFTFRQIDHAIDRARLRSRSCDSGDEEVAEAVRSTLEFTKSVALCAFALAPLPSPPVSTRHRDRTRPLPTSKTRAWAHHHNASASSSSLKFSVAVSNCLLVSRTTTGSASLKKPRLSPRKVEVRRVPPSSGSKVFSISR